MTHLERLAASGEGGRLLLHAAIHPELFVPGMVYGINKGFMVCSRVYW